VTKTLSLYATHRPTLRCSTTGMRYLACKARLTILGAYARVDSRSDTQGSISLACTTENACFAEGPRLCRVPIIVALGKGRPSAKRSLLRARLSTKIGPRQIRPVGSRRPLPSGLLAFGKDFFLHPSVSTNFFLKKYIVALDKEFFCPRVWTKIFLLFF
jgi:hypothetical protein